VWAHRFGAVTIVPDAAPGSQPRREKDGPAVSREEEETAHGGDRDRSWERPL